MPPAADATEERVLQTCVEMVTDRGFAVEQASCDMDPVLVASRDDEVLHVRFFTAEEKIGVKTVRQLQQSMQGATRVLLVSAEGPTPFTRKECADDPRLEFWTFGRLLFNVTRHCMVPKHSLVQPDEAARLAHVYHVSSPDEWPRLSADDPVARYYDFPRGALVRIDRVSVGNAAHPYYRRVV